MNITGYFYTFDHKDVRATSGALYWETKSTNMGTTGSGSTGFDQIMFNAARSWTGETIIQILIHYIKI